MHRSAILALVGFLAAAAAAAQDAPASFDEVIDVEVVNLEVYVTDKKDRPVTGLRAADFELFADGEKVPVTNFYAVDDGRRIAGESRTVEGGEAAAAPSASRRPDPLFLVVFVDNLHLGQLTRNRAVEKLREFLADRVGQGDQVMLVSFDGQIRLRQTFTGDWKAIDEALGVISVEPSFGHLRERDHRQVLEDMMVLSDTSRYNRVLPKTRCPIEMGEMAKRYAERVYSEVHASVSGLSDFVDTLASLPGRKALLHVSDGLPLAPGAGVFEFLFQYCGQAGGEEAGYNSEDDLGLGSEEPEEGDPRSTENDPALLGTAYQAQEAALDATRNHTADLFERLVEKANANGVTFFTLEAYGPRTFSRSNAAIGQRRTTSRRADEVRRASLQDSLFTMAERTGGRAVLDTANLTPALEQIGDDLDTYYSLGYQLPRSAEGRDLNVRVEVRRPGVQVRHRKSLRAKSLAEELAGRTRAALVYGLADNPLAVTLEIGRSLPMDDGLQMVPIRVRIPIDKITLLPESGEHRGQLTLYITGRDRAGHLSPVRSARIPIRIPAAELEAARQRLYVYEVKMLMRPGDHTVAVGVHDDLGAATSYLKEDVVVAGEAGESS